MKSCIDFSSAKVLEINSNNRCVAKDVAQKNVIHFPKGLIGFEQLKNFIVILNNDIAPFMFLQSLDDDNINFVCVESFNIKSDYNFSLNNTTTERLEVKEMGDVLLLSIVTISEEIHSSTANLLSPVIINMNTMRAEQVVLDSSIYPVKYNIWNNLKEIQTFAS